MRHPLVLLAALLIGACSTKTTQDSADTFIGYPTDSLIISGWGPPDQETTLNDGRTVWFYSRSGSRSVVAPTTETSTFGASVGDEYVSGSSSTLSYETTRTETSCDVTFIVDHDGLIESADAHGSDWYCNHWE